MADDAAFETLTREISSAVMRFGDDRAAPLGAGVDDDEHAATISASIAAVTIARAEAAVPQRL